MSNLTVKDCGLPEKTSLLILKLHAEGLSYENICETTQVQYSIVTGLCKESLNKSFIDQYRKNYMARIDDVDISHKRIRLDDLNVARVKLMKELSVVSDGDVTTACKLIRSLIDTLERAQNEMEQRPIQLAQIISGYNAFGALSDEKLYEQKQELIDMARKMSMGRSYSVATGSKDIVDVESE